MAYDWENWEKAEAKNLKELERYVAKLKAPANYVGSWKEDHRGVKTYTLEDAANEVKFTFRPRGGGETQFNTAKGWRTFDRTGVEDSFYWKVLYKGDKPKPFDEILKEQLERIVKSREYATSAISIPGIPFTVSPEGLTKLKEDLKTKGSRSFMPSGFGTGYVLYTRRVAHCRVAPKELVDFLGVGPIYITTFDAD